MTASEIRFSKEYLVVAQNASGRNLNVPVYKFVSDLPGPKVYIQSSIHGAEVQGNVVLYHLLQALKKAPLKGEVTLVPNCNPVGSNLKSGEYTLGRFDPVNGQNWNRAYHYDQDLVSEFAEKIQPDTNISHVKQEYRHKLKASIDAKLNHSWGLGLAECLNLKLQRMALEADIVLDLHNGPVSTRHIYVPEYARESAHYFNIPHVIFIPNTFAGALDEATFCPWWSLADKLKSRYPETDWHFGVEAFTMEMGSQEVIEFEAGATDAKSILTYLSYKGCFTSTLYSPEKMSRYAVYLKDYKTLFSDFGGMVEYLVQPGQKVKEGQAMARVLNIDELDNERATEMLWAPCDLIPILHFPSASVLGGTQLFKCFTDYVEL
ncbi:MAG: succinylglutamate desuccinylase/aspartoacylase family protein [Aestuariibacter sp.]